MEKALEIISNKGLGVLIVKNSKNITTGILTDGDLKRVNRKFENINKLKIKVTTSVYHGGSLRYIVLLLEHY